MAQNPKITLKALPSKGDSTSEAVVTLTLQGELTIDHCSALKEFFIENLNKHNRFVVKLNNVQSIDISAIQLIQRFRWDVMEQKKRVDFDVKLQEEQKNLLEKAGFYEFTNLILKL